jgi:hypothetical protein
MTYPFGSPDFYGGGRNASAQFKSAPFSGPSRVLLVAINGNLLPPIFHQDTALQRTRVVFVPPNQPHDFEPANSLPGVFKHPLPPMPRALAPARQQRPRLVRGEILHDNEGRIYEKIGSNIRPLRNLVSGPHGQVLELIPSADSDREFWPSVAGESCADPERAEGEEPAYYPHQQEHMQAVTEPPPLSSPPSRGRDERGHSVIEREEETPSRAPYRKLFADPGQRRVVRLGDFKALLTAQLAHPERLRDSHWLPCYLQVYEPCAPQRLDSLAASALGDPALAWQLQFLSDALARRLGLTALLKPRPRPQISANARRPGDILPYERLFRFQIERDPTAEDTPLNDDNQAVNPTGAPRTPMRNRDSIPVAGIGLRKSIPERMIKPWEFRVTRDEALYDMNVAKAFAGCFSSLARWLKGLIRHRSETKKWRLLLSGKSADEQLWAVRLPRGGVSHPAIREWARKKLEAGGYDPQVMLLEWEIFWRRKGV